MDETRIMSASFRGPQSYNERFQIIALNNQGATALSRGYMTAALSLLCQALHKSKACMLSQRGDYFHRQEMGPSSRFDVDNLMDASCFGLDCDGESDQSSPSQNSANNAMSDFFEAPSDCPSRDINNDDKLSNSSGVIYRKPIHIPSYHAYDAGFRHYEVLLSSVVIFNLALAHHKCAMMQQEQQTEDSVASRRRLSILKKAAKLYQLAIQLQEEHAAMDGPEWYSKLFFLSCINNLGNTLRLLGDIAASEKTYQHLLTMLMYLNYNEQQQQGYDLSSITSDLDSDSSPVPASPTSSSSTTRIAASFSAGKTYVSFFRNIFESDSKSAPAA